MTKIEQVVLVDEDDNQIGVAAKGLVHTSKTPLHRGFSVFLFNSQKKLLLTRRALTKSTFPGVWTNSLCGHPQIGETVVQAAYRRFKDELGIATDDLDWLTEVAPYRYEFKDENGILENEICPILVAQTNVIPKPNPAEVMDWKWIRWLKFLGDIEQNPEQFSPWSVAEARVLAQLGY